MSVPLKKNTAAQVRFIFLFDGTDIKTTPTIVAGDFQVSIDGGAFGNLATLPSESPAASGQVQVDFSQPETNGDTIAVRWIDQAGGDWDDGAATYETDTQVIGELGTSTNQTTILASLTTILARIGAFTGAGVNTILGFLQAMAQKAATLPTDIGGTFAPATDSLEAIRDALRRSPAAATVDDNELTAIRRGDLYENEDEITGLGNISTRTKLWVTAKNSTAQPDADAVFQIVEGVGLEILNGVAGGAVLPAWGSIAVVGGVGNAGVNFTITEEASAQLGVSALEIDVQWLGPTGTTTPWIGKVPVSADVTRGIT